MVIDYHTEIWKINTMQQIIKMPTKQKLYPYINSEAVINKQITFQNYGAHLFDIIHICLRS